MAGGTRKRLPWRTLLGGGATAPTQLKSVQPYAWSDPPAPFRAGLPCATLKASSDARGSTMTVRDVVVIAALRSGAIQLPTG